MGQRSNVRYKGTRRLAARTGAGDLERGAAGAAAGPGLGIVQGHSWTEMLAQYTFTDGNIWPLVLLVVFVAPLVGWRCKGAS